MDNSKLFPRDVFFQGDTWSFSISLEYDSANYTLNYVFRKAEVPSFTISSTHGADGSFVFLVPTATTATYTPGLYSVVAILSDLSGNKFTLGTAEVQIKPDLSLAGLLDPRTPNRIALDAVEAALAAGAGSDVIEYTEGGTTVKKSRESLLKLRAHYLQRVRAEQGKSPIGSVLFYL